MPIRDMDSRGMSSTHVDSMHMGSTSAVPSRPEASLVGEESPVGSVAPLLNLWLRCTSAACSPMSALSPAIFLSNTSHSACSNTCFQLCWQSEQLLAELFYGKIVGKWLNCRDLRPKLVAAVHFAGLLLHVGSQPCHLPVLHLALCLKHTCN